MRIDGFKRSEDEEWIEVHSGAITNTNPGSMVYVTLNTERICENMSNNEFRAMVRDILDRAIPLVEARVSALSTWSNSERARVARWFGRNDDATHAKLLSGLTRVAGVLGSLTPANFVRTGSYADRATGCMPNPAGLGQEAAHVCAPDTATHTISISARFCTMRQWSAYADSRVSTVIHEVTHFADTMATLDKKYSMVPQLMDWGQENPALAIINADSVAGYVVWGD